MPMTTSTAAVKRAKAFTVAWYDSGGRRRLRPAAIVRDDPSNRVRGSMGMVRWWAVCLVGVALSGVACTSGASVSTTTSSPVTTTSSTTTSTPLTTTTSGTTTSTTSATTVAQCAQEATFKVCPGAAAVGMTVAISSETTCGAGPGSEPTLMFLGPTDYLGTGGGGQLAPIKLTPRGHGFVATFIIPTKYAAGSPGTTPLRTLPVKPGSDYAFGTYPHGGCYVHFTVDAS